ncbi:amphi-Trp domain-containing protein [Natronorubrum sp. DTA28]|uniref:amphi-Trp domain-containing protein n=1 Tax=Natronorubrum sp. DTA28 TaxID=3447019 RepID=UPI003F8488DE
MADSTDEDEDAFDDEFELERAYDRDELAAVFREFATALADDQPLQLSDGERTATVAIPQRVIAEFEVERDADAEPPVAELEVELEWDDADGSSVRLEEHDGAVSDSAGDEDGESDDEASEGDEGATETDDEANGSDDETSESGDGYVESESDEDTVTVRAGDRSGRTGRFEIYEDRAGEWRWRLVHWNGNIVADSGEGYTSRSNAKRAARSVMGTAPAASIEDLSD